jgi:hypothetical protein
MRIAEVRPDTDYVHAKTTDSVFSTYHSLARLRVIGIVKGTVSRSYGGGGLTGFKPEGSAVVPRRIGYDRKNVKLVRVERINPDTGEPTTLRTSDAIWIGKTVEEHPRADGHDPSGEWTGCYVEARWLHGLWDSYVTERDRRAGVRKAARIEQANNRDAWAMLMPRLRRMGLHIERAPSQTQTKFRLTLADAQDLVTLVDVDGPLLSDCAACGTKDLVLDDQGRCAPHSPPHWSGRPCEPGNEDEE